MSRFFVVVFMVVVLVIVSCSQELKDEPPFSFGQGRPGAMVRETKLVKFDPAGQQAVYEVRYPGHNLTSVAKLGYVFMEVTSEVFRNRWTVIYLYDDNMHRALQLPNMIEIYRYASTADNCGPLINAYRLQTPSAQGKAEYTDQQGHSIMISMSYLSVMPSRS